MEFEPEECNVPGEAGEPVLASSGKEKTLRTQLDEPWATEQSLVVCPGWSSHTSQLDSLQMLLPTQDTLQLCSLIAADKTGRDGHRQQVWKAQIGERKKLVHWEGYTDPEHPINKEQEIFYFWRFQDSARYRHGCPHRWSVFFLFNLFPP